MERGEPLATWLFFGSISQPLALWSFLSGPSVGYSPSALVDLSFLLSYGAVSIEIIGSVSLWHRWTRHIGILSILSLQLVYANIAEGAYPYIIACSLTLWINPSISAYLLKLVGLGSDGAQRIPPAPGARSRSRSNPCSSILPVASKVSTVLIYLLLVQQALTPILPYLSNHPTNWSTRGSVVGWQMFTHSHDTLVSWYASKLPNPKTTIVDVGKSYLISHHSEAYNSDRISSDSWSAVLNDPSLLLQWSHKAVLSTVQQTGFKPSQLHINAYRSVNGRPYQLWFKPSRADIVRNNCSSNPLFDGCDDLLEPIIEDFNTLEWLYQQQLFVDEWVQQGYEAIIFGERKGVSFDASFETFSESLQLVLMYGKVVLDVANSEHVPLQPMIGERVPIPWRTFHSVRAIGKTPAAWAYVWPWPRNMTLGDALGM